MRLATFISPTSSAPRVAALLPGAQMLLDLRAAAAALGQPDGHFVDMLTFLDGGSAAFDAAAKLIELAGQAAPEAACHPLAGARLLSPVPRPRSIRDCMAFEQHLIQSMRAFVKWRAPAVAALDRGLSRVLGRGFLRPPRVWYDRPIYYKGNPGSVVGHEAHVAWPSFTRKLDYELEFGVFIGRTGRNIPEHQARAYIAGYTVFNDFSARDFQIYEMAGRLGPAKSKDFDTGNSLGPFLVTPDEVPDPYSLAMRARVNGDQWSAGNSGQMRFTFEKIIAAISQDETLYPGDFIGSGTVPGGCGLELDRWLAPGDMIELEIERLGILRNTIAPPPTKDS